MPDLISIALKEWHLLTSALLAGTHALLLRKGGILESENQFELEHPRFLLYPTFIHQDPRMVQRQFQARIQKLPAEPDHIDIAGYAEVAQIFEVPSRQKLESLSDLLLWDAPMFDMRFNYRPEKPLFLVAVRAFRLPAPVRVRNSLEYAGCKSWVPLLEPIPTKNAAQALPEPQLQKLRLRVQSTFTPG